MLAFVVTGAFVLLLRAMADVRAARSVSRHSMEEASAAREVRNLLIDVESGQRGFIITGDPSFLAPWEAGRRRALPARVAALADMADDPGQSARPSGWKPTRCNDHSPSVSRSHHGNVRFGVVALRRPRSEHSDI